MNIAQDTTLLIQDQQSEAPRWLRFRRPREIIQADTPGQVMQCLRRIEERVNSGLYAAGYIGYEAASGLDPALKTHPPSGLPCLWFGVFDAYEEVSPPSAGVEGDFDLCEWEPSISREQYFESIESIKRHIREGDTYQVNYTFRLRSRFAGDPYTLFSRLYHAQRSQYAAYLDLGRHKVCSVSPEIFMSVNGNKIVSKPMKGTIRRGYTGAQDRQNAQWLYSSSKDRAENVMIVDMIRNDIGRVADNGSVSVPRLFDIERYPTVNQMTSTVSADTSASITEMLRTMFPCASITGAPKVKTMEIIRDLEPDPRGLYTGSIGYIAPDRKLQFNVAIRTVVLDTDKQTAEYGVGGGITWGSEISSEYAECAAKAAVLAHAGPEFQLLESLLWDPGSGYFLLDAHIKRLCDSADYFDFQVSPEDVREKLKVSANGFGQSRQKVRLLVSSTGGVTVEAAPLESSVGARISISRVPIKTDTPYVYHKTTNRSVYYDVISSNGVESDLFLWNEDHNLTETTIANVVIDAGDGCLVTPPVQCGLLGGVKRASLLQHGIISERPITVEQLKEADRLYLINSVRGWMRLVRETEDVWRIVEDQKYGLTPPGPPAEAKARGEGLLST